MSTDIRKVSLQQEQVKAQELILQTIPMETH
jgi:hypothetical protein